MSEITKKTLDSFILTTDRYPNATDEQLMGMFNEFNNDTALLKAAKSYRLTKKKYPEASDSQMQEWFPEFFGNSKGVAKGKQDGQDVSPQAATPQQPQNTNTSSFLNILRGAELGANNIVSQQAAQEASAEMANRTAARKEKESSNNWTNRDYITKSQYERAVAETATGSSLPGISIEEDETGRPQITYNEGSFTFGVPKTKEEIEQAPRVLNAQAKLKSYVVRPNDTEENIQKNVFEAAAENTEKGRAGWAAALADVDAHANQMGQEFLQFTDGLQKQINSGRLTLKEALAQQEEKRKQIQQELDKYAQERQNSYLQELYDDNKDQINWQLRNLGMRRTDESIEEQRQAIANGRKALERIKGGGWDQYHRVHVEPSNEYIEQDNYYRVANRMLDKAAEISDAVKQNKGFFGGFKEGATDLSTWDFGFTDLIQGISLYDIAKKNERWEQYHKKEDKLTDAEQAVLDAAGVYAMAQAYNADLVSRGYKAGQASAESIPFMLEFAVMPLESIGNQTARTILRYAARKAPATGFRKTLRKTIALTVGNLEAAGVQTLAFGLPEIAANTLNGMTGVVEGKFDENGNVVYGGIKEGTQKGLGNAFKDAAVTQFSANFSEMAFSALRPFEVFGRASGMFRKIGQTELGSAIAEIRRSQIGQFAKRTQWSGIFAEHLEENLDGLTQWAFVSDVKSAKDAGLDLDGQIDTFLALAPTSIAFGVAGVSSHYLPIAKGYVQLRHRLENDAEKKMLDAIMRESRSGAFAERAHNIVRSIVTNSELTSDGKRALLEQAFAEYHSSISKKTEKAVASLAEERYGKTFDERAKEGLVNKKDGLIHYGRDSQGRMFVISDGYVSTKRVGKKAVVDTEISDKEIEIRFIRKDGSLSEPQTVKNDFAFGNINTYLPSAERKQLVEGGKAELLGNLTYKYNGKTFSTETGEEISKEKVEEEEAKEESAVQSVSQAELPEGVKPIDTKKLHSVRSLPFEVNIDGEKKIVYLSRNFYLNADGAIRIYDENGELMQDHVDEITLQAKDFNLIPKKDKVEYINAINDVLRSKRSEEIKDAQKKAEDKKAEDEKNAEEAADEQKLNDELSKQKKDVRDSIPMKKGKIDYDSATPEQIVFSKVYRNENGEEVTSSEQQQEALERAKLDIIYYQKQIEKAKKDLEKGTSLPAKILDDIEDWQWRIEGYYAAVQKWISPEAASQLRANVAKEWIKVTETGGGKANSALADMADAIEALPDETRGKKQLIAGVNKLAEALSMEEDENNPDNKPIAILNAIQWMRTTLNRMDEKVPAVENGLAQYEGKQKSKGYEISDSVQEGRRYDAGMRVNATFTQEEGIGHPVINAVDKPMILKNGVMCQAADIRVTQFEYETEEEYNKAMADAQNNERIDLTKEDVLLVKKGRNYTFVQVITDEAGNVTYKNLGPDKSNTVRDIKDDNTEGGWVKQDKDARKVYLYAENDYVPYYDLSAPNSKNAILIPAISDKKISQEDKLSIGKDRVFKYDSAEKKYNPISAKPVVSSAPVSDINSLFKRTLFVFSDKTTATVADLFKLFGETKSLNLMSYVSQRAKALGSDEAKKAITSMRRSIGQFFADWTNYVRDNGINYNKLTAEAKENPRAEENKALIEFARWAHNISYAVQPIDVHSNSVTISTNELPSNEVVGDKMYLLAAYLKAANNSGLISLDEETIKLIDDFIDRELKRDGAIPKLVKLSEKRDLYRAIDNGTYEGVKADVAETFKKDPAKRANVAKMLRDDFPDVMHEEPIEWVVPMSALTKDEKAVYNKRVRNNIKKTEARKNNNGIAFSVQDGETSDEAIIRTGNSQQAEVAMRALMMSLGRVKGINLHRVGNQQNARRVLAGLFGSPEFEMAYHGTGAVFDKERRKIEFFQAPDGTILGWAIGNDIYLTDEGLNSETAIHEYTHLWVKSLRNSDPKAWKKIVALCKKNKALWDNVKNDPNYKDLEGDNDAIASEMLSRYSGKRGAERLLKEAKEIVDGKGADIDKLAESLVTKMKDVLKKFWDAIKEHVFGINTTLDDISDWVLKDLFDGKDLDLEDSSIREEMDNIKAQSIKDGTFMMSPTGLPTKLTEKQWLQVRTSAFKRWYGDWQNPKEGEYFLLDEETKEPRVIYHGTPYAGFDSFSPKDINTVDGEYVMVDNLRAIFMTPQRPISSVYAQGIDEEIEEAKIGDSREVANRGRYKVVYEDYEPEYFFTREEAEQFLYDNGFTGEEDYEGAPEIIDMGADMQNAVYSLFVRLKNPLIVDYSDESGNPREWDKYETDRVELYHQKTGSKMFDSYDEAVEFAKKEGLPLTGEDAVVIRNERIDTDTWCARAQAQGYDGVIFKNIIDGSLSTSLLGTEWYGVGHEVVCAFLPNQVKSATQNKGYFRLEDDRIQYSVAAEKAKDADKKIDEQLNKDYIKWMKSFTRPEKATDKDMDRFEALITRAFDRTEGIRRMLESINAYRIKNGLDPIDGDKYDVRTKLESSGSISQNKNAKLQSSLVSDFDLVLSDFCKKIEQSALYERFKQEVNPKDNEENTLTPEEFLGRYLIAVDSIENRIKAGKARGVGEFQGRMGVNMKTFVELFEKEFGSRTLPTITKNMWDKIRALTDFTLDTLLDGGLLSKEKYDELKAIKYYVPQRGSFNKDEETTEDQPDRISAGGKRISVDALKKAKGGESLAATPLAYILKDAEEAIVKSEKNKVKIAMYNLLRDNEGWCREHGVPVPIRVFYQKTEDGKDWVRRKEPPTELEVAEYKARKKRIAELAKLMSEAKDDETRDRIEKEIDKEEETIPYIYYDQAATGAIHNYERSQDQTLVPVYIDGALCEIKLGGRYKYSADALNDNFDTKWENKFARTIGSYLSAQFTVNNPAFFAVNLARDIPFATLKGWSEYGFGFTKNFYKYLLSSSSIVGKYAFGEAGLIDEKELEGDDGIMFEQFLMAGGNTGYSSMPDLEKLKAHVTDLGMKPSWKTLSGKDKLKRIGQGADKVLSVLELRPFANAMNEYSELLVRFSLYRAAIESGLGQNEAVKAAHNMSVNFNRRGLGHWFMNLFNSLSVFANATVQGACGFYRTFYTEGSKSDKFKKAAKATSLMILGPAFMGFIDTILNPDDDKQEYTISEWDRENYAIIGRFRKPLSEQIRPFWNIGVNIALAMRGSRTIGQCLNSIITSSLLYLTPMAPAISKFLIGIKDMAISDDKGENIASALFALFSPQALETLNLWGQNRNIFGRKLRFDIEGKPEYMMGDNEAALYKDIAYLCYLIGSRGLKYPSTTRADGQPISKFWNRNPREIKQAFFALPPGAIDLAVLIYGIGKDTGQRLGLWGGYEESNVRIKDIPIVNRFWRDDNSQIYQYTVVRDAKKLVKDYTTRISTIDDNIENFNMQKSVFDKQISNGISLSNVQQKSYDILSNSLNDLLTEKRKLVEDEKYRNVEQLKKLIAAYEEASFNNAAKKMKVTQRIIDKYILASDERGPERIRESVKDTKDTVFKIAFLVNESNGLHPDEDTYQWIKWIDDITYTRKKGKNNTRLRMAERQEKKNKEQK